MYYLKDKLILASIPILLILSGCGGGGSSIISQEDMARIDNSNNKQIARSLSTSIRVSDKISNQISNMDFSKNSGIYNCTNGNYTVLKSTNKVTYTYSNCQQGDSLFNGKVTKENLSNPIRERYTAEGFKKEFNDGSKHYMYEVSDFVVTKNPSDSTPIEVNINAKAKNLVNNNSVEYKNFSWDVFKRNDGKLSLNVDGYYKTNYTNSKWVEVDQINNAIYDAGACPTEGEIKLNGNSSYLEIKVSSNTNVNIYTNGTYSYKYNDCSVPNYDILP